MTDRTLTAAEHPRGLSPLVEAVRLENAIKRKRRQVEKLATKLEDAEFERQVFERELARLRPKDSELSVGVAATAMGGHEVPAQNRQPVGPPSDPATGTTRREPPESARMDASTGAVTDSGGDGRGVSASPVVRSDEPSAAGNFLAPPVAPLPGQDCKSGHGFVVTTTGNANGVPAERGDASRFTDTIDMTGQVLGELTVLSRRPGSHAGATWTCQCSCGAKLVMLGTRLRHLASTPRLAHLLRCRECRLDSTARKQAARTAHAADGPAAQRCGLCREPGHNATTCPSDPSNATRETVMGRPEKVRPRNGDCPKCFSMPSRVEGARCAVCRLEAEAPPRATDFTSGESPLGRAV